MGDESGLVQVCQEDSITRFSIPERCFYQIVPPIKSLLGNRLGVGDCSKCAYDPENNKKCPGYTPHSSY